MIFFIEDMDIEELRTKLQSYKLGHALIIFSFFHCIIITDDRAVIIKKFIWS